MGLRIERKVIRQTINAIMESRRFAAWPGIAAVLLLAMLSYGHVPILSPALERIGLLVFDSYQRSAPRPYSDAAVRVVDIDDESIRRFGQWPWPRTDVARLTDALGAAGAAVIAFDIVFSEPDRTSPPRLAERLGTGSPQLRDVLSAFPDNDRLLADSIARNPVVLGYFLTQEGGQLATAPVKAGFAVAGSPPDAAVQHYRNAILPLPPLLDAAAGAGFVSLTGKGDAIVRKAPLIAFQDGALLPSLSLDAVRAALQAGSITVRSSDASGELGGGGSVVALKVGDFTIPTTAAGELWMHYTRPESERVVPAWQILSGKLSAEELRQRFEGTIVFVGAGAIGLRDLVSTPLRDRELGVMVHAQAAEQMILGQFLIRPDWAKGVEVLLLLVCGIGLALALPGLGATKGAFLGGGMLAAVVGGGWAVFAYRHMLVDPTYPVLAVVLAYTLVTILTYYREERQRAYIHTAFDRYLSPELVKRIADDPGQLELGGEVRPMTVLFCDIRGFSRISEQMSPRQIIDFLIAFLTPMTDVLLARQATIDKYIGDAILAFWNAPLEDPDQHRHAARAALEMAACLKGLNAEMPGKAGLLWPGPVRIGIGLNAGPCCVGNMGSSQRLSYSLIGDTVNLASRIEGLTKHYGVEIAMGASLQSEIPDFATLPIDLVRVVGRGAPEMVHALLGDEALASSPDFQAFAERHRQMMAAYRRQAWGEASALLDALDLRAQDFGFTRLYGLYRQRIAAFAENPPGSDWDGVYTAGEK